MYRPADRRFNLLDSIILIAALAIMLAGLKSKYEADLQYAQSARLAGPAQVSPSQPRLRFLLEGYMPHILVPLTVAFAAMRFRRPRPGRRRLMMIRGPSWTRYWPIIGARAIVIRASRRVPPREIDSDSVPK